MKQSLSVEIPENNSVSGDAVGISSGGYSGWKKLKDLKKGLRFAVNIQLKTI